MALGWDSLSELGIGFYCPGQIAQFVWCFPHL